MKDLGGGFVCADDSVEITAKFFIVEWLGGVLDQGRAWGLEGLKD